MTQKDHIKGDPASRQGFHRISATPKDFLIIFLAQRDREYSSLTYRKTANLHPPHHLLPPPSKHLRVRSLWLAIENHFGPALANQKRFPCHRYGVCYLISSCRDSHFRSALVPQNHLPCTGDYIANIKRFWGSPTSTLALDASERRRTSVYFLYLLSRNGLQATQLRVP
jgi:hypothetical protein